MADSPLLPQSSQSPAGRYRLADLTVDTGRRSVTRGDATIELPKLSYDLLVALVTAAPNPLSIDDLVERVWSGAVVSNATVAKRVELLREALGDDSQAPKYIALVRSYGYRLIPKVLSEAAAEAEHQRSRSRNVLIAAVLAVMGVVAWFVFQPATPPPEKSIAVLPFQSFSSNASDQVFADGLTEELSHTLARNRDLKVSGRYSTFHFRDRDVGLKQIAVSLGVAHLLIGAVRRDGDQLRITVELINAVDGRALWSESYDRTMSDIIDIQQSIASNVASQLGVVMGAVGPAPSPETSADPAAYALYLKALSLAPYGAGIDLAEAQRLLTDVVELDPEFADAWSLLASVHARRLFFRDPGYTLPPGEALLIVRDAVAKALAINPDSAPAYANLAGVAWAFEGDAQKAAPLIERSLDLDSTNIDTIAFAAEFTKFIGRLDDALALEEYLVDRDPLCDFCRFRLLRTYYFLERFNDMEREARVLQDLRGAGHQIDIGLALLFQGRAEEALDAFELTRNSSDPDWFVVFGRALALHDLERRAESAAEIDAFIEGWGETHDFNIAQVLAYTGRAGLAFERLQKLTRVDSNLQVHYPDPLFNRLHDDPRWIELLEQIGRAPEQLDQIDFSIGIIPGTSPGR